MIRTKCLVRAVSNESQRVSTPPDPPSGGGSASSNLAGGAIRNRRLTCGSTFRLIGGQADHIGVWQYFGNRILSISNSSGRFGGLGSGVVERVGFSAGFCESDKLTGVNPRQASVVEFMSLYFQCSG